MTLTKEIMIAGIGGRVVLATVETLGLELSTLAAKQPTLKHAVAVLQERGVYAVLVDYHRETKTFSLAY